MPEPAPSGSELEDGIAERLRTPLDAALSDANRLRIQAALHGLTTGGSIRFTALAKVLNLTDGNLAAHLAVLSEVGYVEARSTYTGKRRTRWYSASAAGREAFEAHVRGLQLVIDSARVEEGRPRLRRPDSPPPPSSLPLS